MSANVRAARMNELEAASSHPAIRPSRGTPARRGSSHCVAAIRASAASRRPPPPSTITNETTFSRIVARTMVSTDPETSGGSCFQIARKVSRRWRNKTEAVSRMPARLMAVATIDSRCRVSRSRVIVAGSSGPKLASRPSSTWCSASAATGEKRRSRPSAATSSRNSGTSDTIA